LTGADDEDVALRERLRVLVVGGVNLDDARRQGLAQHMLRELVQWGVQHGSHRAYLQVEERNTAAVTLYGKVGFTTHHTYLTREAPR